MIFNGQVRRTKPINLGNKQHSSKQDTLKRAEQERLQRQQSRQQTAAAVVLQKAYRRARSIYEQKLRTANAWSSVFAQSAQSTYTADSGAAGFPEYIFDFLFFSNTLQWRSPTPDSPIAVLILGLRRLYGEQLGKASLLLTGCLGTYLKAMDSNTLAATLAVLDVLHQPYDRGLVDNILDAFSNESLASLLTSSPVIQRILSEQAFYDPQLFVRSLLAHSDTVALLEPSILQALYDYSVPLSLFTEYKTRDIAKLIRPLLANTGQSLRLVLSLLSGLSAAHDKPSSSTKRLLEPLYTPQFLHVVAAAHQEKALAAHVLLTLLRVNSSRRSELLMHLMLLETPSLLHGFWNSFKSSPLFHQSLHLQNSTSNLQLDSSEEWDSLAIAMEMFSFWLVISNDAEFLTNSTQGLPLEDICTIAEILRNLCFAIIWHPKAIPRELMNAKPILLTAIRQVYVRDSRRHFLPKGFWIMEQYMGLSKEAFRLITGDNLKYEAMVAAAEVDSDDSSDEEDDQDQPHQASVVARQRKPIAELSPRLAILRQVPFFIQFHKRAAIFNGFISDSKERNHALSFFDYSDEAFRINRENLLEDSKKVFSKLGPELKSKLRVSIYSDGMREAGIDGGGLTKEILTGIMAEAFHPKDSSSLWSTLFVESAGHSLYPNPEYGSLNPNVNTVQLRMMYSFLGQAVAKCLYENVLVDVDFAAFFLQKWAGSAATKSSFDDFYLMDPEIYNSLIKLYQYAGDAEDLALDFVVPGTDEVVELKPGGSHIPVTNANKLEYIHAVANYKLNTVLGPQTGWFLKGMGDVISLNWLKMFNAQEIQTLISGECQDIDVDDLIANSEVSGFTQDQSLHDFWSVVREMTPEERGKLVKFVTSVSKAPLLGFKELSPRFGIRSAGSNDERLPTSSTCTNLLRLPEYSNKEILRAKLLQSIESNAGFDLS